MSDKIYATFDFNSFFTDSLSSITSAGTEFERAYEEGAPEKIVQAAKQYNRTLQATQNQLSTMCDALFSMHGWSADSAGAEVDVAELLKATTYQVRNMRTWKAPESDSTLEDAAAKPSPRRQAPIDPSDTFYDRQPRDWAKAPAALVEIADPALKEALRAFFASGATKHLLTRVGCYRPYNQLRDEGITYAHKEAANSLFELVRAFLTSSLFIRDDSEHSLFISQALYRDLTKGNPSDPVFASSVAAILTECSMAFNPSTILSELTIAADNDAPSKASYFIDLVAGYNPKPTALELRLGMVAWLYKVMEAWSEQDESDKK